MGFLSQICGRGSFFNLLASLILKWNPVFCKTQTFHGIDRQGYSIRTRQWRFTEWNGGKDGYELYNHENDPNEVVNLANNPDYLEIREQLKAQLKPFVKYK